MKVFLGTNVAAAPLQTIPGISPVVPSTLVSGLTNGTLYTFTVAAVNQFGTSAVASGTATPVAPTAPAAPTTSRQWRQRIGDGDVDGTGEQGGSPITGFSVRVVNAGGNQVGALRPAGAAATSRWSPA